MSDELQSKEDSNVQDSPAKIPANIRKWILAVVGVIGACTLLITTSDKLMNAGKDFWCEWIVNCSDKTKYTEFLLDTSADMDKLFLTQNNETAKSKWLSLTQDFAKILLAFPDDRYAVRYFGQAPCENQESTDYIVEFDHDSSEVAIKNLVGGFMPKGEPALIRALRAAIDDFKDFKGPKFINKIIVLSAGKICDFSQVALDALRDEMKEKEIVLDLEFVALDPDVTELENIKKLVGELGGEVYYVDEPDKIYTAVVDKKAPDVFTIAKKAFDNVNEGRALAYFNHIEDKNSDALVFMARIYLNLTGGYREPLKGYELYTKAVNMGNPEAMYRLGRLLENGRRPAIDPDPVKAKELIDKAAAAGYEPAKQYANK